MHSSSLQNIRIWLEEWWKEINQSMDGGRMADDTIDAIRYAAAAFGFTGPWYVRLWRRLSSNARRALNRITYWWRSL